MNQETRNFETEKKILDSGERRQFDSGAVRDIQEGKGRCDLLPLEEVATWFFEVKRVRDTEESIEWVKYGDIINQIAEFIKTGYANLIYTAITLFSEAAGYETPYDVVLELSKHYEEGAKKYDERNWEKGIPCHCFVDSGIRHLTKYFRGDQDEPHDRAFLWNMFGLLWTIKHKPELNDLPYNTQKENNI